jgi:hypothetical protein
MAKQWCRALVAALLVLAAGCDRCRYAAEDSTSSATLSGVMSAAEIERWESLEGRDAGPAPYAYTVTRVGTFPFHSDPACPDGQGCVLVQPNQGQGPGFVPEVVVRFDTPKGVGTFQLQDLHAEVCDVPCAPIVGMVEVTQLTPPCDGGCDSSFTGTLTITSTQGDGGPTIAGMAPLHYQETFGFAGCGNGGG